MTIKNIFIIFLTLLISCKTEEKNVLELKLEELAKLKEEQVNTNKKITKLEGEINKLDPSRAIKPKLVSISEMTTEGFQSYINLQGMVASKNISYIAPRNGMGGYVKQLYIKEGQAIKKGQLIMKLDDQVLRQSMESVKSQMAFAKNIYDKTKSLWDQNIGTEVQLLAAKNNVDALQNQLSTMEEQLNTFQVYADQSGIADVVNIKVGELFTGINAMGAQIQIVNNNEMSIKVDVPENYSNKVRQGAKVIVEVPSLNKTFNSIISKLNQTINATTRGFTAEIAIPSDKELKPNMAANVKILNHANAKAIVIPINIVQSDEKGKYVYLLVERSGKKYANKRNINIGELYGEDIEIKSGLNVGDKLIIQGYQDLYEGQLIENN